MVTLIATSTKIIVAFPDAAAVFLEQHGRERPDHAPPPKRVGPAYIDFIERSVNIALVKQMTQIGEVEIAFGGFLIDAPPQTFGIAIG